MTVIEFFDRNDVENITSILLLKPERVIFVGDSKKQMRRALERYELIIRTRGIRTVLDVCSVNRNNLESIVTTLSEVVAEVGECTFDLSGGEEFFHLAVGILMERFGDRVSVHRLNLENSVLTTANATLTERRTEHLDVTVDEYISLYNGHIVTDPAEPVHTYPWVLDEELARDVETMFEICRRNEGLWNATATMLGLITSGGKDALAYEIPLKRAEKIIENTGHRFRLSEDIMSPLAKAGLIRRSVVSGVLHLQFKNEAIKRCLTIAGQVLELHVAMLMRALRDEDGRALYTDVRVGTVIDWAPDDGNEQVRTLNEIDVIAMKDGIPVFISCKNGDFSNEECYKLRTVAAKFGGESARTVIVASETARLGPRLLHLRARASEMGIRLVELEDTMDHGELLRLMSTLWCK